MKVQASGKATKCCFYQIQQQIFLFFEFMSLFLNSKTIFSFPVCQRTFRHARPRSGILCKPQPGQGLGINCCCHPGNLAAATATNENSASSTIRPRAERKDWIYGFRLDNQIDHDRHLFKLK